MTELATLLYGLRIGTVTQSPQGGRHSFAYESDYAGPPLSSRMPVVGGEYPHRAIEPFLDGLLPDDLAVRQAEGDRFGVSGRNAFALLAHLGLDCAGAVQFCPAKDVASVLKQPGTLIPVNERQIGERLAQSHQGRRLSRTLPGESRSLAGWQPKFTLRLLSDGSWAQADGAEPSTHIFKPGIPGLQREALTEHATMATARRVGLEAARTVYQEFNGKPAIIVTRYDRRLVSDNQVIRIHQEDYCQALGLWPSKKYESDGGPGVASMARLLDDLTGVRGREQFARYLAFAYVCGVSDTHAKNFSVLILPDGSFTPAPLYDAATVLYYQPVDRRHPHRFALSIGGERVFGQVTERHWTRAATQVGIEPDMMLGFVHYYAEAVPDAFHDVLAELPTEFVGDMAAEILPRLDALCRTCLPPRSDIPGTRLTLTALSPAPDSTLDEPSVSGRVLHDRREEPRQ